MFVHARRNLQSCWRIGTLLLCFVGVIAASCSRAVPENAGNPDSPTQTRLVREVRYVMGTLLDITLYADSRQHGQEALDEAFAIAERLDSILSTYKDNSDVSQLNRVNERASRQVSPELYRLISRSQGLSKQTRGAFDITVRPLVTLWEKAAKQGVPPTEREISEARQLVGFRALEIEPPSSVVLRKIGVEIETGGIGKGFAVDEIVAQLKHRGVSRSFVNFGRSSMAAIGAPEGQIGWKVDLELEDGIKEGVLFLRDETLSVSRARGNPFIVGKKAYAHIFDPSVGYPIEISRGAAVRGSSATDGEAYVKYLVVRGAPADVVARKWGSVSWIVKTKRGEARTSPDFWSKP